MAELVGIRPKRCGCRGPEERLHAQAATTSADTARQLQTELGFRMVCSGRTDLVPHGLQLLPRLDCLDPRGLSPLMVAAVQGDEALVQTLLDLGASPDIEVGGLTSGICPGPTAQCPAANSDTQHWTALTFATAQGHYTIVKLLLDKGACVEGGAKVHEEKATETPLQLAAAAGAVEPTGVTRCVSGRSQLVELLLSRGARPFLSTAGTDSQTYGSAPQRGCHSAIAAAASHGQRSVVHLLLSHPTAAHDMLSLEEILAEGFSTAERRIQIVPVSMDELDKAGSATDRQVVKMTRAQLKALQEAMYQSAENTFLEITLDLRNLGECLCHIPSSMRTLARGHFSTKTWKKVKEVVPFSMYIGIQTLTLKYITVTFIEHTQGELDGTYRLRANGLMKKVLEGKMNGKRTVGRIGLNGELLKNKEKTSRSRTTRCVGPGVPWSLHCWLSTLATAHDRGLETVVDQLLRDFLQGWPEDGPQFGEEGLPLLFSIFRHCKKEETLLLLADIFSRCYGNEPIKDIPHISFVGGPRIDPKYVNNPEMSDIQFRVEGRPFYSHRIILVNASPKFQALVAGAGSQAVVIKDIRYHIFQVKRTCQPERERPVHTWHPPYPGAGQRRCPGGTAAGHGTYGGPQPQTATPPRRTPP
ncbi:ABTB2 [Cordylochernes scorpioides]|uniref:ABTB2 n=1 Tax=Cordylochernes scorpioides TaxID=51811 RepID=A0ABY6L5I3_9ARAC|nr:ABTB2 [Cordylochernes scorpioides]